MFLVGKRFALSSTQPNPPSCTDLKDSSSCFTVKAPSSRSKWSSQALMLGGSGSGQLLPGRTSWNLCLLACSCPSSCLFPLLCRCSFYCLFFCRVPWSYPCLRSCLHSPSVSTSSPPNDVLARSSRNTRRRMSVQIGQVLFRLASAFCLSCWSRKPSTSVGSPPSRRFFRTPRLDLHVSSVRSDPAVDEALNHLLLGLVRVQPFLFSTRGFSSSSDNKLSNAVMLKSLVRFSLCPVPSFRRVHVVDLDHLDAFLLTGKDRRQAASEQLQMDHVLPGTRSFDNNVQTSKDF